MSKVIINYKRCDLAKSLIETELYKNKKIKNSALVSLGLLYGNKCGLCNLSNRCNRGFGKGLE